MIIDFHCHTFPEKIAAYALRHMQSMSHNAVFTDGTASALRQSMATAGVFCSVVLPVVTNPSKTATINDLSIVSNGKDGLIYFGGIHPDTENVAVELQRIHDAGIKGIKLHPLQQGTDIDDPRYLRILECCGELGMIVVLHAGADPGFPNDVRCTPKMIRNALDQVGPVQLIAAHMGSLMYWDTVPEYLLDTGTLIDTSFALGAMAQTDENFYTEKQLQLLTEEDFCNLVSVFGKERVLFGSDSPWNRQIYAKKQILALPLDADTKAHIFYKNACRLLQISDNEGEKS